jgi:hypothetical protein
MMRDWKNTAALSPQELTTMATRERLAALVQKLVEAAMDQPSPSSELTEALNKYLNATEHRNRSLSGSHVRDDVERRIA